jgi:hypothetical protein
MNKFELRVRETWPEETAERVLGICRGTINPLDFKPVAEWVGQCHNMPSNRELKMAALNAALDGHGIEPIWRNDNQDEGLIAEYVNMGDTYATTIVLEHCAGLGGAAVFYCTSWGDWLEKWEATNPKRRRSDLRAVQPAGTCTSARPIARSCARRTG